MNEYLGCPHGGIEERDDCCSWMMVQNKSYTVGGAAQSVATKTIVGRGQAVRAVWVQAVEWSEFSPLRTADKPLLSCQAFH